MLGLPHVLGHNVAGTWGHNVVGTDTDASLIVFKNADWCVVAHPQLGQQLQ